jgi:hypothetical protein
MRIALCTTTIRHPHLLRLLRAYDPNVGMFIAGDMKTPDLTDFSDLLGPNTFYLSAKKQKGLGYHCSEPLGWNCIQRRNIAVLEAAKWGADAFVLWDDDNAPLNASYFYDFFFRLGEVFNGLKIVHTDCFSPWVNPSRFLIPPTVHRGIPYDGEANYRISFVLNAKIGVVAGMCLGDTDVGAVTRMVERPKIHQVSKILESGFVVDPSACTVWNSQNTAVIRNLLPAMFLMPGIQRYDDIFASIVCQRVMRANNYYAYFGRPYVYQERNEHDLMVDLKNELFGMENATRFAELVNDVGIVAGDILGGVRAIVEEMSRHGDWLPQQAIESYMAWIEDCKMVMK